MCKIRVVWIFTIVTWEITNMKNNTAKKYLGPKEIEVIARLSCEEATLITKDQVKKGYSIEFQLNSNISP